MSLHPDLFALGYAPCALPPDQTPLLFVVVDTEEEFDWNAPFSRDNTGVQSIAHINRLQRICERVGVAPTYVIDYPIASQPHGYAELRELAASGACEIGAHTHPWVTPPFLEDVSTRHSFAFNLPPALQQAKLLTLVETIAENLGVWVRVYKAGRYGFGPSTVPVLERLAFDVDVSIIPHMNFTTEGGPSFDAFDARPFVFGRSRRLLEVPCTTGYVGLAGPLCPLLHRVASTHPLETLRAPGILARLGAVNKIMLSPEGNTLEELRCLTTALLARGVRTFSLTLHSPSLDAGHTPYVRTAKDLQLFLSRIEGYLDFFMGQVGGRPSTLQAFKALVDSWDESTNLTSREDQIA